MLIKKKESNIREQLPKIMILLGIVVIVIAVILLKNSQEQKVVIPNNESAEEQLDRYVDSGKPVFAFFHSNSCQSCLVMTETVSKVYPAFEDQIALVDIDVYDSANQNLLRRVGIHAIPTQVFFDTTGQGMVTIGAMTQEELIQQFKNLLGQ